MSSLNDWQVREKTNVKVGDKTKVKARVKTAKQKEDVGRLETQTCVRWGAGMCAVGSWRGGHPHILE